MLCCRLDYPGIGPEHSYLSDIGRAEYYAVTDDEALEAFQHISRLEGIIPALETSHAFAYLKVVSRTSHVDSKCLQMLTSACINAVLNPPTLSHMTEVYFLPRYVPNVKDFSDVVLLQATPVLSRVLFSRCDMPKRHS